MQRVPDNVLQWLYNNLKPRYQDVDRAYSDVARTLSDHPALSPRTDVFTFENGTSALLLVLSGTLAVPFRGATYRYPLALWIPYAYPREPPMIYVVPTSAMTVRPGQHVSLEGRVYHPYLAQWRDHWNVSNLLDTLSILRDVFAKEPPVAARPQQDPLQQPKSPTNTQAPALQSPPPGPLPGPRSPPASMPSQQPRPPPPPPKPPEVSGVPQYAERRGSETQTQTQNPRSPFPPSLPPKPPQANGHAYSAMPEYTPGVQQGPPPPRQHLPGYADEYAQAQPRHSMSPTDPSLNLPHSYGSGPPQRMTIPYQNQPPPQSAPPFDPRQAPIDPRAPPPHPSVPSLSAPAPALRPPPAQPKQPTVDLLSTPVETILAGPSTNTTHQPAPPIPPNPEKDAIIQALASTLATQHAAATAQNAAALPALEAQHAAMQHAQAAMQAELAQLQTLDGVLAADEAILHEAMREADRVMDGVRRREVPSVDDVLVAPTVVAEQLYGLVADVQGIADAMFALSRALDKGRVGAEVFVKQTRTLARERFFKEALIKKIARGMGLTVDEF